MCMLPTCRGMFRYYFTTIFLSNTQFHFVLIDQMQLSLLGLSVPFWNWHIKALSACTWPVTNLLNSSAKAVHSLEESRNWNIFFDINTQVKRRLSMYNCHEASALFFYRSNVAYNIAQKQQNSLYSRSLSAVNPYNVIALHEISHEFNTAWAVCTFVKCCQFNDLGILHFFTLFYHSHSFR